MLTTFTAIDLSDWTLMSVGDTLPLPFAGLRKETA
jgi:hypothetical protein